MRVDQNRRDAEKCQTGFPTGGIGLGLAATAHNLADSDGSFGLAGFAA